MVRDTDTLNRQADELYEQYGKSLEVEHTGEYVAIFPDGQTVIGPTVGQVVERAVDSIGQGSFIFCIGRRWVWKIR